LKNDPAIYQDLSEVEVQKQGAINFDNDIERLSQRENKFQKQEKQELVSLANHPRLKGVMQRIQARPYSALKSKKSGPNSARKLK